MKSLQRGYVISRLSPHTPASHLHQIRCTHRFRDDARKPRAVAATDPQAALAYVADGPLFARREVRTVEKKRRSSCKKRIIITFIQCVVGLKVGWEGNLRRGVYADTCCIVSSVNFMGGSPLTYRNTLVLNGQDGWYTRLPDLFVGARINKAEMSADGSIFLAGVGLEQPYPLVYQFNCRAPQFQRQPLVGMERDL